MTEEQQLAFPASQLAESQVVVAKELEIQATQVTPANKRMQLHSIAQSKGELQEVHGPSCCPTQANQDELAAVTDIPTLWGCSFHDQSSGDVSPSGQSPEDVADPQAKQMEELKQRIQLIKLELAIEHEKRQAAKAALQKEVEQTTLQRAVLQNVRAAKTALAKAQAVAKALLPSLVPCRSSTKVELKADVKQEDPFLSSVETKSHVALTHTSHKFRAPKDPTSSMQSLKRTGEAHTSPDAIIHHDSLVHPTASVDVHCGSKCTSVHHDLEISVSDEDGTNIPSPAALPDQRDITSSLATEVAECHFHSAQTSASGMGYRHSTQHDIKSHPPDEVSLDSPHSSVCTISPKDPLSVDKLVRVQSLSSPHNLCPTLYTDEKVEGLSPIGDKAIGNESTHQPMLSPLVNPGLMDLSPTNAQSCISSGCTDQPSLSSSKGLVIPVSMIKISIMLTPITLTGYHHLPVRLSKVPQHHISLELNLCWSGLWHLSLELNLCWPWLQTAWPVTHAWHVKFPIGIWSTVINFILSSFPMLMCYVISLENMISFRRMYLICQDTCSMKPIFLVIVVTILPLEQFQCT